MSNLNEFLTFDPQNEHDFEHVLEHDSLMKKSFSNPKIYQAKGNLKRRWYVYYSFRNPQTGKLERMKNVYGIANSYKTKEDRLAVLTIYRKKLLQLLKEVFDFSLQLKKNVVKERTFKNYQNRVKLFLKWVKEHYPNLKTIDQLSKKMVIAFLNEELQRTNARSRNNYRVDLSSILQVMEDNEIIPQNFIKNIKVLKAIPQRNKTYTQEKQQEIFKYLEK